MVVEECKSWFPHYADWSPSSAILRRSGAVLLLPPCAFMTWTGTGMTSTFYAINAVLFFSVIYSFISPIIFLSFLSKPVSIIFSCNIPVVLDNYKGAGVVQSNTTNIIWCSSLLIRLHVSALSLGHLSTTFSIPYSQTSKTNPYKNSPTPTQPDPPLSPHFLRTFKNTQPFLPPFSSPLPAICTQHSTTTNSKMTS